MLAALVRFSVRFNGIILGMAFLILVYGVLSLTQSKINVFPEFSPKQVVIQTEAAGFSAELVEILISQPIERAISGTIGVKTVRSQSIRGLSVVTVIFNENTNIYLDRQLIAERLGTLTSRLPQHIVPDITPLTSSASTLLGIGFTSDQRSLKELRSYIEWTVRPAIMAVQGVADVNAFGGEIQQLQIQVNPDKLIQYRLSLNDVVKQAQQATGIRAAGFIENNNQRIVINSEGQSLTQRQLEMVVLTQINHQPIRLRDVATVSLGAEHPINAATINGKLGVYLSIQGQLHADTKRITQKIEQALQEMAPAFRAQQITFHPNLFKPANFIDESISGIRSDLLMGSALVVITLLVFLFNLRTAIISATAIPLSLLSAIVVMHAFDIGINIMILGGLAIALGEVVDDAIIDTENIYRRLRENRDLPQPLPAARVVFNASMEVRSSVVYATFIVALVFVPLLTMPGIAGKFFGPLAIAYITAIMSSLLVALTLTPALCYLLLPKKHLRTEEPPLIHYIKQYYVQLLIWIEQRHRLLMGTTLFLVIVAISLLPLFKTQFIPRLNEGHYILHMTALPGTSLEESLRIGGLVSQRIREIPGVKSVTQWVGRAVRGADTFGVHYSEFEVETGSLPHVQQERVLSQIRHILSGSEKASFTGVNFAINTFLTERIEETIADFPSAVNISVYGNNLDTLDKDAQAIAHLVRNIPGATDVQIQAPPATPQLLVRLNHEAMAIWGIQPVTVLEAIQAAYEGIRVGQVYDQGQVTAVSVILSGRMRQNIMQIGKLPVQTLNGTLLTLDRVANIELSSGRSKILHTNGKRIQTVSCNVENRDIDLFNQQMKTLIQKQVTLSPGNYLHYSGTAEAVAESRQTVIADSLIACVGILLILYLAFGQVHNLLLASINLPFALTGGVLAAIYAGGWISIGALIGFVTLFGITLRNSIMLVSHYHHLVHLDGRPWNLDTAVQGASERLPSILMTALVTGLGLLPLAISSGEVGREIEGPMATIIVGGLITSTILNLLILPTLMLHYGNFKQEQHPA